MPPVNTPVDQPADNILVLSLASLRRRSDVVRRIQRTACLDDLATSVAHVPQGEVQLDLSVEVRGLDVVVAGQIETQWQAECRRCLEEVTGKIKLSVTEVFRSVNPEAPDQDLGDTFLFDGTPGDEMVSVEAVVRDAVLLALPLAPLCQENCQGPAPERFPAHTENEPIEQEAAPLKDPRWAALDGLRIDDEISPPDSVV